jgi:TRAP-type transport system small permease protein
MATDPTPVSAVPPSAAKSKEHVLDDSGHFHATDAPVDLSHYTWEAWIAFGFFWLLAADIFYQFFTRYVLNSSAGWTEEIARYLLIAVVFIGIPAIVAQNRHIHVDFLYRYLPKPAGRALSTFVDVVRIVFFAGAVVLTLQMMGKMESYKMTIIDLPMNIVYGVCGVGFAFATVRAVQVAIRHWRQGWSLLERPESLIDEIEDIEESV